MPVFETFAAMKQHIENDLKDALANEIADMVDHTIKEHAASDVYGAYSPHTYDRRDLLKAGEFYLHEINGFTLTVLDVTPGDKPSGHGHNPVGTELADIIEHGLQGNGGGGWKNAFARPYMANAQEEVIPRAVDILKSKFA